MHACGAVCFWSCSPALMQLRPPSDLHMRPREASSYVNSWKIYFYQSHSEDRIMGACG